MTMQSVMFYVQAVLFIREVRFFLFFVRLFPAEVMDFTFLKRNTGIFVSNRRSLILFDFIMSETQLFKEDYHS